MCVVVVVVVVVVVLHKCVLLSFAEKLLPTLTDVTVKQAIQVFVVVPLVC